MKTLLVACNWLLCSAVAWEWLVLRQVEFLAVNTRKTESQYFHSRQSGQISRDAQHVGPRLVVPLSAASSPYSPIVCATTLEIASFD